jgi:integrase/recombinase XerD
MKQARTLTDKQLKTVFIHCATRRHALRDKTIIAVSFYAGLRAKEIAALTIENVRDYDGSIRDEFVLTKEQTKGRKARRVFICQKLKTILNEYLKAHNPRKHCVALFQSQCQWRRENVPDGGAKVYRSGFEKRATRPFWLRSLAR